MIGKIVIGKSFKGCIKYCLEDKISLQNELVMQNRAEVLMYDNCYGNQQELVQQFNEVRQLNTKLSKPVLHITLSLALGEKLSKDKLMEMCEQCAKDMSFANNQYLAVLHHDTNHQHLHIVANRIGFDSKTVCDGNNYQKIANHCRQMEQKYGLKQVLNPKKFLSKEQRKLPRLDQRKELLRQHIRDALSKSHNYGEFENQMKERGYYITKGRGISFTDEKKVTFKGSEVNYSLQTIARILQKQGELQATKTPDSQVKKVETAAALSERIPPQNSQAKDISKIFEQVIQREEMQEQLNPNLLQKRKRRKKQSRHL